MKWEDEIKPKSLGGLGFGSLVHKKLALLAKWWWRFGVKKEALWRKVSVSKYGEDNWGWVPKFVFKYRRLGC